MTSDQWIEVLKYLSILAASIVASVATAWYKDKRVPAQNLKDKAQADLDTAKVATSLMKPMQDELDRMAAKITFLEEALKRLTGRWRLTTDLQMGSPAYVVKSTLEPIEDE